MPPRSPRRPVQTRSAASRGVIEIRGARQNNLKSIDLDLPLGKLIVMTGPSGSGKSSLAFDTLYAEGQRRYIETFSPYTRQFFERMDKPQVDEIRGIPPAIAIQQSNSVRTTRSTVGTLTEINDYLKLVFPRLATAVCPECGREVRPESPQQVAQFAARSLAGRDVIIAFPVPVPPKTAPAEFFAFLQSQGFLRIRLYGEILRTDEPETCKRKSLPALIDVVQDRLRLAPPVNGSAPATSRLLEALEQAFHFGKGQVRLIDSVSGDARAYSRGWHCADCDTTLREPSPALFSFNNAVGACPQCRGFGRTIGLDIDRALPDKSRSIRQGVVRAFQGEVHAECQRHLLRCARARGVDIDCPFEDLPAVDQRWVVDGEGSDPDEAWRDGLWFGVRGFFKWIESRSYRMHVRVFLSRYRAYTECPECRGGRLRPEAVHFRIGGRTLPDWWRLPVSDLAAVIGSLRASGATAGGSERDPSADPAPPTADPTTAMLLAEIESRLRYLARVGLGYLSLDRPARTLSGGEVERVNLTSCLGAGLVNTLFVMDEPTVGLHPRDVGRMLEVMRDLRDKGNTLVVVEHEESVIRAADEVVDIGPGRGRAGGEVIFHGPLHDAPTDTRSLTLDYLSGRKSIPVPARRRPPTDRRLRILGAAQHNLRKIDVEIPLRRFVCLTGVSGSGKSTLVHDVLYENLLRRLGRSSENEPGRCRDIEGAGEIRDVVMVDQSPLSRTPRSTPAVYVGAFDGIRALFAGTAEAIAQSLPPAFFSFNSGYGRCQRCFGAGAEKVEMQFLSDLYVTCPACSGSRYTPAALAITFAGRSIADLLEMTVAEAIDFLSDVEPRSTRRLRLLVDVGLDYLKLGQPLNTLSGGESQRLKLVAHLAEMRIPASREKPPPPAASRSRKEALVVRELAAAPITAAAPRSHSLLIFDEPTTGLHFDDVRLLLEVFHRLTDEGHSLIVIEHNIDVIKNADWVIDLGPEAGAEGGRVVAAGTPEDVARVDGSHTGHFLREAFDPLRIRPAATAGPRPPAVTRTRPTPGVRPGIAIHGARETQPQESHPRDPAR